MKAVGKNILVEVINEQVKTKSGLILSGADKNENRHRKAKVFSVGDEVNTIKAGDIIYYDSARSFSISLEQGQLTVIQERDVVIIE